MQFVSRSDLSVSEIRVNFNGAALSLLGLSFANWLVELLRRMKFFKGRFNFDLEMDNILLTPLKASVNFCIWINIEPESADAWYSDCLLLYLKNSKTFPEISSSIRLLFNAHFIRPFKDSLEQGACNVELFKNVLSESFNSIVNDHFPQYSSLSAPYPFTSLTSQNDFVDVFAESNINSASNFVSILYPLSQDATVDNFNFLIS